MKKKRIIAGALSIALLFGVLKLPSLFASEPPMKVYVSSEGVDTNSGTTEQDPVKTLSNAFEITGNGATIVVMDEALYDLEKSYGGARTILGNNSNAVLAFGEDNMELFENLVIKNIVLKNQSETGTICTNDYTLMIGEGVTYQGATEDINPIIITGADDECREYEINKTDFETGNLVINSESYSAVTRKGTTPVAITRDGKHVYVADETGIAEAKVYLRESAKTDYNDYISYRKGLPNTFKKLSNGESINVIYFGGSVTVGTGAGGSWGNVTSDEKDTKSWRALISSWLEDKYPEQINNINEGLGESGTYMGSYRINRILDEHVRAGETPDLFFIEYSINDYYARGNKSESLRYDDASSQFETIVREIKSVNPNCDIVTVLVADNATMSNAKGGILHTEAQAHDDISKAYNMPTLKFGSAIANKVSNLQYSNDTWKKYFTDIVHPTSEGYQEYYKCIEEFMHNSLMYAEYIETELPELAVAVQSKTLFDGNRTAMDLTEELFDQSTGTGFVLDTTTEKYEFDGSITAANAGATFTYSFNGTETSILTNKSSAAKFTVKIDGEAYTPSAGSLSHNPITLAKGLNTGSHTVEITTVEDNTAIYAIFTHDASITTRQGADEEGTYKKACLELPTGSYFIKYYDNGVVADITKPLKDGLTFYNWYDEAGKLMYDNDKLLPGMKLTARFWVNGKNINPDVNQDGYVNENDTQTLREILVEKSEVKTFDVNCDGKCNVKDLVALKKFLRNIWQRDNNFSVNDL